MKETFLEEAERLKPALRLCRHAVSPHAPVTEEGLLLDFETHMTGYVSLRFSFAGARADSPVMVRVFFAERLCELEEDPQNYRGWISRGWIQEEILRIDSFPREEAFSRRFAFRYIKITPCAVPREGQLVLDSASVTAQSAAGERPAPAGRGAAERKIDEIALKTLSECMQDVIEDGPKRDRRLWAGDLRLAGLSNGLTFRDFRLVKRCLYLFAGTALSDGRICQSVFADGTPEGDEATNFDYPLQYAAAVSDYYFLSGDREAAEVLLPCAEAQILASRRFFTDGVVRNGETGWCFVDWSMDLDRQAAAQGIYLFAEEALIRLLIALGRGADPYEADLKAKREAGRRAFFDPECGLVRSGDGRQVSLASQIWALRGGMLDAAEGKRALAAAQAEPGCIGCVTPYLVHDFLEALLLCGEKEQARRTMLRYYGGMAEEGADTFWEFYFPENPSYSPYGGTAVHSYCHVWSSTPCYLLRKYFAD